MTAPTCTATLRAETGPCERGDLTLVGPVVCERPASDHEGDCPRCEGRGEYETEGGPVGCMPCVSGLGPYGHPYLGPSLGVCGHAEDVHPDEGMVRFEWAETARPAGLWYYRTADLSGTSVLRRDHAFTTEPEPERE